MTQLADAVANKFLDLAWDKRATISPMKMQKLVYFSHGWHLAIEDAPLISEPIQAWKFGPVIQSLYREFREFGDQPITRHAKELRVSGTIFEEYDPELNGEFPIALVGRMWEIYGPFTAIQLSNMTHEKGSPWCQVADHYPNGIPMGRSIPNEIIRDYFRSKLMVS